MGAQGTGRSSRRLTPPNGTELGQLVRSYRVDRGRCYVALGDALLAMSKPEDALCVAVAGLRVRPRDVAGRIMMSRALIALERLEEAEAQLRWVVGEAPRDTCGLRLLGEVLLQQKRYDDALPVLERALWLDSADPALLLMVERARRHRRATTTRAVRARRTRAG